MATQWQKRQNEYLKGFATLFLYDYQKRIITKFYQVEVKY